MTKIDEIPMAQPITDVLNAANGELYISAKVKTFFQRPGGKSTFGGKWYKGVVTEIHLDDHQCTIEYEAGFTARGHATCVWLIDDNIVKVDSFSDRQKNVKSIFTKCLCF